MIYRDVLQQIIYKVINPLIKGMIKIGMTPNSVTTIGFLLNVVAAVVLVYGGLYHQGEFSFLTWFGALVLFAGLFDMMDGRLARMGNMSSTFGAMYDSVLDRYSELITLSGVCYWLFVCDYQLLSIVTFVALIGSIMVSYIRARAEGLGVECKVGFMQRPERVVLISLGALFTGIFKETKSFDSIWILGIALVLIAVLANVSAFVRLNHCKREMFKQEGKEERNC